MTARTSVGRRLHTVIPQNPGAPVPDGDGGYEQDWFDVVPRWFVSIVPATARDLERVIAGTVLATASHVVTGPYLSDVSTRTRLLFGDRVLQVTGVADPEERHVELVLVCVEVETVPLTAPPAEWIQADWMQADL